MKNKKINFKQPKYIIPLIVLPFLVFLNFVIQGFFTGETKSVGVALEEKNEINIEIPEPSDKSKEGLQDKFDSYLDNFKDKKEHSAIQSLEENGGQSQKLNGDIGGSLYTEDEIRKLDSLNDLRGATARLKVQQGVDAKNNPQVNNTARNNTRQSQRGNQRKSAAELEKEDFIEQMRLIDSIQSPEKYIKKEVKPKVNLDSLRLAEEKGNEKSFLISNKPENTLFNANIRGKNESQIKAILDEGLTVYEGSRVRIRLLTDLYIDQHLLEKGKYLYGIVSGFSAQRVQVSISSVILEDRIYPINVTVYDNDGIPGFYVPDSKFREIANQLGNNMVQNSNSLGQQNSSTGEPQAEQQKFMFDMINSAYKTATSTVKNMLNKNKAHLKYNTVVYLINENENKL